MKNKSGLRGVVCGALRATHSKDVSFWPNAPRLDACFASAVQDRVDFANRGNVRPPARLPLVLGPESKLSRSQKRGRQSTMDPAVPS